MPCEQCENGKYKWGKTGSCKYDTKAECEEANKDYYKKNNTMNPTPLGKKSFEEYAKELKEFNLSSQRVELGLVDDIEKLIKSYEQDSKKLDTAMDNWYNKIAAINKDFPKVSKLYTSLDKSIKSLSSDLDVLNKQAKDLGLNVNDIPAYKNANAAIKRSEDMVAEFFEANRIAKTIKAAF
tara:strand:+ start:1005 stop:1547 length:543 start_codon:yes stop_codon:yes gene_type:complete